MVAVGFCIGPSTGLRDQMVVELHFFVLDGGRLQISARQGLEGRAQPVPAGVRSATRGMEPEGGTPESA